MCMYSNVFANSNYSQNEYDELIKISTGNGTQEVGHISLPEGNRGVEDFMIANGYIYILDSVNSKILVYNNSNWIMNIPIVECVYAGRLYIDNDNLYVLDMLQDTIYQYDMNGNVKNTFTISNENNVDNSWLLKDMYTENGTLVIEDFNDNKYTLAGNILTFSQPMKSDNSERYGVHYRENECVVDEKDKNLYVDCIGYSEGTFVTNVFEYDPNSSNLDMELTLREYNSEGEVQSYALIEYEDWYSVPRNYTRVIDGDTYILQSFENETVIEKVNYSKSYNSQLVFTDTDQDNNLVKTMSTSIPYSRNSVLARCESMCNTTWTVQSGHKVIRSGYSSLVTIPSYIGAVGTTVTGIPYCWGGFFGLDANANTGNTGQFSSKITSNASDGALYTAGNINTSTSSYQSCTIGLDCSGFVSSAYGLTTKYSTTDFSNNFTSINKSELSYGDILCKAGSHVIIYVTTTSSGYYSIYDAAKSTGCTQSRTMSAATYSSYTAYSPW